MEYIFSLHISNFLCTRDCNRTIDAEMNRSSKEKNILWDSAAAYSFPKEKEIVRFLWLFKCSNSFLLLLVCFKF